jgi:predicted GNAT superfamily acetyltransferase
VAEVVTLARDPTGATEQAARDAAGAAAAAGVVVEEVDPERVPQVEHLANTVWGRRTGLSRDIVSALEIAGGVMLLAYPVGDAGPGGDPCGFTLGFFGVRGGIHLHSHMTAVLPRFTSHGVGYAIKLAQRAACLDRGVTEVQWTFDPLLARNARFNLSRLGAGARWFRRDVYGVGHDRISGADRTDRLGVTWPLSAERTRLAIAGRAPTAPGDSAAAGAPGPLILHSRECAGGPEPEIGEADPRPGAVVELPLDYAARRHHDPEWAQRWREASAVALERCFDAGLVAAELTATGGYVFTEPEEDQ